MSIPLTDAALKKKLKKLPKTHRHDVWRELSEIGCFFALVGAAEDALAVWRFAYSGQVPFPEDSVSVPALTGAAISGVCFRLEAADISKDYPPTKYIQADESLSEKT